MDKKLGLFGPFENPDDIKDHWHLFTEENLEEYIKQAKEDIEEMKKAYRKEGKGDQAINEILALDKQDLKNSEEELQKLREFAENYERLKERYKFDKKILNQTQQDWHDYNDSLYYGWNSLQIIMLGPQLAKDSEELKAFRRDAKNEEIKREEIGRRFKELLSAPLKSE